jgi:hypothetical protein
VKNIRNVNCFFYAGQLFGLHFYSVNYVSLFVDGLEHFFPPLNISGIVRDMPPKIHARLYTELSVTVVQL